MPIGRACGLARSAPGGPPKAEPGADVGPAAPQAPPHGPFTQKTYVHASDEDLQHGQAALAKIHKIA